MIWIWVGIFFILLTLWHFTKSKVSLALAIGDLLTIVLNLSFNIIYYYEILSFIVSSIIVYLVLMLLSYKKIIK